MCGGAFDQIADISADQVKVQTMVARVYIDLMFAIPEIAPGHSASTAKG
jgi:hypothetical protein